MKNKLEDNIQNKARRDKWMDKKKNRREDKDIEDCVKSNLSLNKFSESKID